MTTPATHSTTMTAHDAWGRPHTWTVTWTPLTVSHRNNHNVTTQELIELWGADEPPAWPAMDTTTGGVSLRAPVREHAGVVYGPNRVDSLGMLTDPGDYHAAEI